MADEPIAVVVDSPLGQKPQRGRFGRILRSLRPMTPADKQMAKQGWLQLVLQLIVIVGSGFLAFSSLSARADTALEKATEAKIKAAEVESDMKTLLKELALQRLDTNTEMTRIRTILEERLPKK